MESSSIVLVDTNVIIEAVRVGCWTAVTGGLRVETVVACEEEARARPLDVPSSYVPVEPSDLERLAVIHPVSDLERAGLRLAYPDAHGMDRGEHDLMAHLHSADPERRLLCSPDKASVRAAVHLGLADHLCSLDELVEHVGARAPKRLRRQFRRDWLRSFRTKVLLEEL